jgi:hypothetical protein
MSDELRCKNCNRSLLEVDSYIKVYIKVPVPPDLSNNHWIEPGGDFELGPPPQTDSYCLKCWNMPYPAPAQ